MRIFKWKSLVGLVLVGVCSGSTVRALADNGGKDKPSASPAGVKIDAASSASIQTASDSNGSGAAPSGKGAGSPEAVAAKRESSAVEGIVSETKQSLVASEETNQEPKRRALHAPLDGIFPGADYLGPTPLIGVPDTDPVYPLTKAIWAVAPALKTARIKVYGWINPGISVSTSNKSNIPEPWIATRKQASMRL